LALEKLLLYDEAIESYKRVIWEFERISDEEKEDRWDLEATFNLARLYEVMNKKTSAYTLWKKIFEEETIFSVKCDALRRMMWTCEDEKNFAELQKLLAIYDNLKTDEFADDIENIRNNLEV